VGEDIEEWGKEGGDNLKCGEDIEDWGKMGGSIVEII
jgi:hypothetical protein